MGIHGYVYVIIGAFVAGVSYFNDSLKVFVYIGIAFVVIGLLKVLWGVMRKEKKIDSFDPFNFSGQTSHPHNRAHHPQSAHQQPVHPHQVALCPQCRKRILAVDAFCRHCGRRMRQ